MYSFVCGGSCLEYSLSKKININQLKTNQQIQFTIDQKNNFIKEFTVRTTISAKKIASNAREEGIGISLIGSSDNKLLIAVTEKRTAKEIETLISFLKRQSVDL